VRPARRASSSARSAARCRRPRSCVPTIVGSQVVGSVLVQTPERLGGSELEDLETRFGRYGGEEFVALLPGTSRPGGAALAEKVRQAIEDLEIADLDRRLSASFGVAMLPGDAVNSEQLLRAADRALYAAKNAGRNRVEVVSSGEVRDETSESGRLDDDLVTGS
jgi:predicted signal transduction protein with EAL and GGDEF domain